MQEKLYILDAKSDACHGWKRPDNYSFAARDAVAPLLMTEVNSALPYFPLAFVKQPGSNNFSLVVLLGLYSQENLYLDQHGCWKSGFYIPSYYRAYPFALQQVPSADGQVRFVLAFNRASGLFVVDPGNLSEVEKFFADDGELTPLMKRLVAFLRETSNNHMLTAKAVDIITNLGLLESWQLSTDLPVSERRGLDGLYRINWAKLHALNGDDLKTLNDSGGLPIAYAQLFSMGRLSVLRKLSKLRCPSVAQPSDTAVPESVDALFDESESGSVKFDWSKL